MKNFISDSQKIGKLGEDIASKFLMKHGFSILERNYTKKWGEIDIVAKKNEKFYFVEVKSRKVIDIDLVSYETNRPEENMHYWKMKRLSRTVQTYLIHNRIGNTPWQFDLLVVYMDIERRKARVMVVDNVIL
jgi:putative endonuclease